ncbi:MAG TPA: phosphomethylpyrimidine synthase ThiC [Methanocellales archaeon]|nr:phosphomethylpyrimidine synthase ThiC [Methanocellales archaeon]
MSMTQIEEAKSGRTTREMVDVALHEKTELDIVRKHIASGEIVIMTCPKCKPLGIGKGLLTKVNVNIGTSSMAIDPDAEVKKAMVAVEHGANTISDLSMGGDIDEIRRAISDAVSVPLTTVPIYQTTAEKGSFHEIDQEDLIKTIKKQVQEGVSSVVIHAGFTLDTLTSLKKATRIMGMVSKGGAFTAAWMIAHKKENPFLEKYDEILEILLRKDIVLSLGNAMRSGCVHDMSDKPQLSEIQKNAELARHANDVGVQTIVEGMGGHVPAKNIVAYVRHHKKITGNRPLFVSGPLPTDIAVGYDHIAACIGASLASGAGADYLCAITPSEHLALPSIDHVREGTIACRIAAHIGDSMKYGLSDQDFNLAKMRRQRNWEGQFKFALDGERARQIHSPGDTCTMCGDFCALKIMEQYRGH